MGAITTTVTAPLIYCSVQLDSEIALSREIVQEHLETEGGEWGIKKLTEINWRAGSGSLDCFLDVFHYQLLELSVAKTLSLLGCIIWRCRLSNPGWYGYLTLMSTPVPTLFGNKSLHILWVYNPVRGIMDVGLKQPTYNHKEQGWG